MKASRLISLGIMIIAVALPGTALSATPTIQPPVSLSVINGAYSDTPTMQFVMWSFDSLSDGVADIYVGVRSRSDMPVPHVMVTITACSEGERTPLSLAGKVRHMDVQHESLHAYSEGRLWQWEPSAAPANTDRWMILKLPFKAFTLGSSFCVRGVAGTTYDQGVNAEIVRNWNMK